MIHLHVYCGLNRYDLKTGCIPGGRLPGICRLDGRCRRRLRGQYPVGPRDKIRSVIWLIAYWPVGGRFD